MPARVRARDSRRCAPHAQWPSRRSRLLQSRARDRRYWILPSFLLRHTPGAHYRRACPLPTGERATRPCNTTEPVRGFGSISTACNPLTPTLSPMGRGSAPSVPRADSAPGGVTLHAARIGGGAAAAALARSGSEASFAPVGVDFDDVTAALQVLHGRLRQPSLDHQHARPRGARPERDREML